MVLRWRATWWGGLGLLGAWVSGCTTSESACLEGTELPLTNVCPKSGTLVKGVDVSKWQANVDFTQVK